MTTDDLRISAHVRSDSLDYCSREIRKHVKVLDGETYASVIVLQRDYGYAQVTPTLMRNNQGG